MFILQLFMLMCLAFTYVFFLPTSVRVRAECDWCSLSGSYGALCSVIHCCWKADWQTGKIYFSVGTLLKITLPLFCQVFCAACCFVFYTMHSLIPRLEWSPQWAWKRGYTMLWNGVHNPSTLLTTLSSCTYYKQLQNLNSLHVMPSFTGGICMGQTAAGQLVWL